MNPPPEIKFPTNNHASWINQIEVWFSILVRKLLKWTSVKSVDELNSKILNFIEYYNRTMAKPFKWKYQPTWKIVTTSAQIFKHAHFFKIAALLLCLAGTIARSSAVTEITAVDVGAYLIDSDASNSDPLYDRDKIKVSTDVNYNTGTSDTFRLTYRLATAAGVVVQVLDQTGSPADSVAGPSDSIVTLPTISKNYVAYLTPAVELDKDVRYQVHVRLERERPDGSWQPGSTRPSVPAPIIHFTNTTSGDASRNVVAILRSVRFSKTFLVDTDPSNNAFTGEIGTDLYRYDGFDDTAASDDIDFKFTYSLHEDGTGTEIALEQNEHIEAVSMNSFATGGGRNVPFALVGQLFEISIDPSVQLDPVTKSYYLKVTMAHDNVAAVFEDDGELDGASGRLLHFNGTLVAGDVTATVTAVGNIPSVIGAPGPDFVNTAVKIDDGFIDGKTDYSIKSALAVAVKLQTNGDAHLELLPVDVIPPDPANDIAEEANVRFSRSKIVLRKAGAFADIVVALPSGMGYVNSFLWHIKTYAGLLSKENVSIDQMLNPKGSLVFTPVLDPTSKYIVVNDDKAVGIVTPSITWVVSDGRFDLVPEDVHYVREYELEALKSVTELTNDEKKVISNELYHKHVIAASGTSMKANPDGVSEMTATFDIEPGQFTAHFPYGTETVWKAPAGIEIVNSSIDPANSALNQVDEVTVPFSRGCEIDCGTIVDGVANLRPDGNTLVFDTYGGLHSMGTLQTTAGVGQKDVEWGYIDALSTTGNEKFAQETADFANAGFFMPGYFLPGMDAPSDEDAGGASLLLSGVDPANPVVHENPDTAPYAVGSGDYAGMNFRVAQHSGLTGESILGGSASGSYTLKDRSKYYARQSGVSGIHESITETFPDTLAIYGYPFEFENYGLSYLSNEVFDSVTEGSLDVPYPSDFTVEFTDLYFNCLGALTSAELVDPNFGKAEGEPVLDYWNADLVGLSILFQPEEGMECDPSSGFLTLGVKGFMSNVEDPLYGVLGFEPDGTILPAGTVADLDSRMSMPSVVKIDGPSNEEYQLYPMHDAYFNDYDSAGAGNQDSGDGFLSLAAEADVPFFEDLEVVLHTGASEGNTTDLIHMTGGWEDGGLTFFDGESFDVGNVGYPGSATTTLSNYRQGGSSDEYLPVAQQDWLDVIQFAYPLDWSTTTRSFQSPETLGSDFLVIETEHEVRHLSADNAELDFGVRYEGLPSLNLSNIAFELAENTGALDAVIEAGSQELADRLLEGFDAGDELLEDRMDAFYDRVFDQIWEEHLSEIYADLAEAAEAGTSMEAALAARLCDGSDGVLAALEEIDGSVDDVSSVVDEIDDALAKTQLAIRCVIGRIGNGELSVRIPEDHRLEIPEELPGEVGEVLITGLFSKIDENGDEFDGYDIAEVLLVELVQLLSPEIAANLEIVLNAAAGQLLSKLEEPLNEILAKLEPTIEDVKLALVEVYNAIGEVREAAELYDEITAIVSAASTEMSTVVTTAKTDIEAVITSPDFVFDEYSEDEMKELIKGAVRAQFDASEMKAEIQEAIKHQVQDLQLAMEEAVSSAFQQLNTALWELLEDYLPELDTEVLGMLHDLGDKMGSGQIDGYAHINEDALRHLRLDAKLQLKIPDDFEFNGYLEINQMDSEGDGNCSFNGEGSSAAEVIIGAENVPVAWTGEDLAFDVEGKFTFDTGSGFALRGMGGSVEMTEGHIDIEALKVTSMAAAAMFGKDENYVGARLGLEFDSYALAGGAFFGRTCSLDPILVIDPDVGAVLGSPPFTGLYAYGEANVPIIGTSCLFNISALVGAGVFVFVGEDDTTVGGKMRVGASGEALCIVEVGGDITLVGAKEGNNFSFLGAGRVFGEVGICPVCTSFDKRVTLTYKNNKWDVDY